MKKSFIKVLIIPAFILSLVSCGGGSGGGGVASLVTIANVLGVWLASSANDEGVTQFTLEEVVGVLDEVNISSVLFDDGTSDVGFITFTDSNTSTRAVRVQLSAGTFTGTVSLSNNCQTMNINVDGAVVGTFSQSGNTCTDTAAATLLSEEDEE